MKSVSIFLDSGAFSVFSNGGTIDINDYMAFIDKYKKFIDVYVNLDVIGDADGTWKNQEYMESQGFKPLPVYHGGDDIKYLHRCLTYPYFCLGGMAKGTADSRLNFLDMCWNVICDSPDRLPKSKVHGLGLTALSFLFRYPWWSVDSSSWLSAGRFGNILIPKNDKYTELPWKITVSTRSPTQQDEGQHINTLSILEQEKVLSYLHKFGFVLGKSEFKYVNQGYSLQQNERWCKELFIEQGTVTGSGDLLVETLVESGVCNNHILRDHLNFVYFRELEKNMPKWPQPFRSKLRTFGLR